MTMKAWLSGDEFDLAYLVGLLSDEDARVVKEDNRFYLTAPELDASRDDVASAHDIAESLMRRINGWARINRSSFKNVTLEGRYQDGEGTYVVGSTATLEIRAHVSAEGVVTGDDVPPQPSRPNFQSIAEKNPDVAEALEIMGAEPPPIWWQLWKVYEIVKHARALAAAMQAADISDSAMTLFTWTANHEKASGADARHARSKTKPPRNPMPVEEARAMIGRLVRAWVDSLAPVGLDHVEASPQE